MIDRKQRNIIWENNIRNKVQGDLIISLLKDNNEQSKPIPFVSKNILSRLFKGLPIFGGSLYITPVSVTKENGSRTIEGIKIKDLRYILSNQPSVLGFIITSENERLFISSFEADNLLKGIYESPNPLVQNKSIKEELIVNLICTLSWLEVELVSETL